MRMAVVRRLLVQELRHDDDGLAIRKHHDRSIGTHLIAHRAAVLSIAAGGSISLAELRIVLPAIGPMCRGGQRADTSQRAGHRKAVWTHGHLSRVQANEPPFPEFHPGFHTQYYKAFPQLHAPIGELFRSFGIGKGRCEVVPDPIFCRNRKRTCTHE